MSLEKNEGIDESKSESEFDNDGNFPTPKSLSKLQAALIDYDEEDDEKENYFNPDPKAELKELIQVYRDDAGWTDLKGRLSNSDTEVLEVIRCFLAGEWESFTEQRERDLYEWTNYRTGKYSKDPAFNKHFNSLIRLGEESLIVSGYYKHPHFSKFSDSEKDKQLNILTEVYCDLIIHHHLGIIATAAENSNAIVQLEYFYIRGILPSVKRETITLGDFSLSKFFKGVEASPDYCRSQLSKYEMAGFHALFSFGQCVLHSYEHYCHQKNAKTKFNKTAAKIEDYAVDCLIAGKDSCYVALGGLGYEILSEHRQQADEKISKLMKRSSQGGKKPPEGFDEAFQESLNKIIKLDTENQLSPVHVADLVRRYLDDRSHYYQLIWKQEIFKVDWFVTYLKEKSEFPAYLSDNTGKTKKGREDTIHKIEENLGI